MRDGKEVRAILPAHTLDIHQTKIGLVDQRRGLEGLPGMLLAHVPVGDLVQFGVDQRRQLVEGRLVAITPGAQQPGYFQRRGRQSISSQLYFRA
jgi:hypothetical protein